MTNKPIDEGRAHDVEGVVGRLDDHAPLADDRTLLSDSTSIIRSLQEQLEKMERETVSRISGWVDSYSKAHQRALAAEAEVSSLRDRVAEAEVIIGKIPGALNSQFSAGMEEREGGSARRQERLMEAGEELKRVAQAWSTARAVKGGRNGE